MKTKRKLLLALSGMGLIIVVAVFSAFTSRTAKENVYKPLSDWKNLQVLPKDISKDSLDFLMEGYAAALSVKCSHCHTPKKDDPTKLDFANDDKIEKEIARGMIKMTNELNENYFKPHFPDPKPKQVHVTNCVMCHRGAVNPEKYLSKMGGMYKTYNPDRDNRKEKFLEHQSKL